MNDKIYLSGSDWKMKYFDRMSDDVGELDYTVPSNVEHSFINAGLLPKDLFFAQNVRLAEKYETYDYEFTKFFDCDDVKSKYRIVFEGVDTLAEYYVNGVKIGQSDNMLVEHVFDVNNLKQKANELKVKIYSTTLYNNNQSASAYTTISWNNPEYVSLRRAGHTYGWDIMPRLVSAGIFKDVYLEKIKTTYIKDFYLATRQLDDNVAFLQACYEIESNDVIVNNNKYTLEIKGICGQSSFCSSNVLISKSNVIKINVSNPLLWWPKGAGKQNLYSVTAILYRNGDKVDDYHFNFGIRTVKLLLENERGDDDFTFVVNGEKLFMRGSNHVPLSPLHSEDIQRVEKEFEIISDMQMNMVRCWGGNVYESNEFYNLADKHGVLIWQDFTFGCATYPLSEEFFVKVEAEAEKVIKRLRNHPCIALYAGDNEVDCMLSEFNISPQTNTLTRKILSNQVNIHDPYRDYIPSSPFITEKHFKKYSTSASNHTPERHLWGMRDWYKSPYYKDTTAKFVSEIGIHGSVNETSLKKFIPNNKLDDRYDESWVLHSTDQRHNNSRIKLMEKHIKLIFNYLPKNYSEFSLLSSYVHAEGFKFYLENMRFKRPYTTGILLWNHLDGWPQFSEAFSDYFFNKKLGYSVIKRSYEPILMGIYEDINSRYQLKICNDTLEKINVQYRVYDGQNNEEYASGEISCNKNECKLITTLSDIFFDKKLLIIEYQTDNKKYFNHFITGFPTYTKKQFDVWYDIIKNL